MCLDKKQPLTSLTESHTALSTSLLILLVSISPSCNLSATWDVKMPICVPETCNTTCSVSETLKIFSVLRKKKKEKAALESHSPDKNMQFSQGQATLHQPCSLWDSLVYTMHVLRLSVTTCGSPWLHKVGIEASLNWLWCSWRDETVRVTCHLGVSSPSKPLVHWAWCRTPHSPQTKLKAAMAGPQETFQDALPFCLSRLFSHCGKFKLKQIAKMQKRKDIGRIHNSPREITEWSRKIIS